MTATLLAATLASGFASRWFRHVLPYAIAEYGGDTLWAAAVFFGLRLMRPTARGHVIAAAAFVIAVAVELSQLAHPPWLDALRHQPGVGLILGYGFLVSDLVCYAAGVASRLGPGRRRSTGAAGDTPSGCSSGGAGRPHCRAFLPDFLNGTVHKCAVVTDRRQGTAPRGDCMKILYIAHERSAAQVADTALRRLVPNARMSWARDTGVALGWLRDNGDTAAVFADCGTEDPEFEAFLADVRSLGMTTPIAAVAPEHLQAMSAAFKANLDGLVFEERAKERSSRGAACGDPGMAPGGGTAA